MAPPEHKIGVFVRFCPSEPPFSGVSSTKSGFLCAFASKFLPDGTSASKKPHLAEKSTPVWLAIWRTWAGFANSQHRDAANPTPKNICSHFPLLPPWAAAQTDANLSAHLHQLPTPPACLRRMRLQPGRGRCQMANEVAAPRGMHRGKPHCGNAPRGTCRPGTHRGKPHCGERTEGARYLERTTRERTTWERTVRRILFAGFEALCVFGNLELVYHLLNLTIHKDRQVVG